MSAAPGWYPDPAGSPELRLWDGTAWTSQTMLPPQIPTQNQKVAVGVGGGGAPESSSSYYYGSAVPSLTAASPQRWSGPLHPAPKSDRRWLIGGAGVVIVAAAVATTLVVQSSGSIYERTHIAMPETAAGFKKLAQVDSKVGDTLAKSLPIRGISLGIYAQSGSHTPAAMLMAGRARMTAASIQTEMGKAQSDFSAEVNGEQAVATSPFQEVAPGPLGGKMACATLQVDATPAAACVFVDEGAVGGIVTFETSSVDNALMLRLRSAIEKRS